jgi:hypothetical protein
MSFAHRQSLQNKQCFHNLYAYLSAARNNWEMLKYSECRDEILDVIGYVICALDEDWNHDQGWAIKNWPAALLASLRKGSDELYSCTKRVEHIVAQRHDSGLDMKDWLFAALQVPCRWQFSEHLLRCNSGVE